VSSTGTPRGSSIGFSPGGRFADHASELHRRDYLDRATAGGYPEALARTVGRRCDQWFDNYVNGIVRREAGDISNLQPWRNCR
jgi:hypothetical protein